MNLHPLHYVSAPAGADPINASAYASPSGEPAPFIPSGVTPDVSPSGSRYNPLLGIDIPFESRRTRVTWDSANAELNGIVDGNGEGYDLYAAADQTGEVLFWAANMRPPQGILIRTLGNQREIRWRWPESGLPVDDLYRWDVAQAVRDLVWLLSN